MQDVNYLSNHFYVLMNENRYLQERGDKMELRIRELERTVQTLLLSHGPSTDRRSGSSTLGAGSGSAGDVASRDVNHASSPIESKNGNLSACIDASVGVGRGGQENEHRHDCERERKEDKTPSPPGACEHSKHERVSSNYKDIRDDDDDTNPTTSAYRGQSHASEHEHDAHDLNREVGQRIESEINHEINESMNSEMHNSSIGTGIGAERGFNANAHLHHSGSINSTPYNGRLDSVLSTNTDPDARNAVNTTHHPTAITNEHTKSSIDLEIDSEIEKDEIDREWENVTWGDIQANIEKLSELGYGKRSGDRLRNAKLLAFHKNDIHQVIAYLDSHPSPHQSPFVSQSRTLRGMDTSLNIFLRDTLGASPPNRTRRQSSLLSASPSQPCPRPRPRTRPFRGPSSSFPRSFASNFNYYISDHSSDNDNGADRKRSDHADGSDSPRNDEKSHNIRANVDSNNDRSNSCSKTSSSSNNDNDNYSDNDNEDDDDDVNNMSNDHDNKNQDKNNTNDNDNSDDCNNVNNINSVPEKRRARVDMPPGSVSPSVIRSAASLASFEASYIKSIHSSSSSGSSTSSIFSHSESQSPAAAPHTSASSVISPPTLPSTNMSSDDDEIDHK